MPKIPVFYYHSVGNIGPQTLALDEFASHLDHLKKQKFNTLKVSDLINQNYDASQRNAVITFDDGLLDNYDKAFPLLQEKGFSATFFIIAGFDQTVRWVNPKTSKWSDEKLAGYTISFPSMQKHHRDELIKYGMEIGCHSMTHQKLNKIPKRFLTREIIEAKSHLEQQHGLSIESFCYPKGRYNDTVIEYLQKAGFKAAFTTIPGFYHKNGERWEYGRFLVENQRLFAKILDLAVSKNRLFDALLDSLRPVLKWKNYYL